jgi:lipopolysaccharide heptosyltransferase I
MSFDSASMRVRPAPFKILIVRLSSLGDILHVIPAQQGIARQRPEVEVHWVVEGAFAPLVRRVTGVSRVWEARLRDWRLAAVTGALGLIRALRRERFELALDFQGLLKSGVLARLSGARRVVGLAARHLREPRASHFYTHQVDFPSSPGRHVIEINYELARFCGCNGSADPRVPLQVPPEADEYVGEQLRLLGVERPLLFNPGAGWVTKLWPAENYARLAKKVKEGLGRAVVFTYGPGEEGLVEQARAVLAPDPLLAFPTNIFELAALCRRSCLMVAGDTGPLHLAVALGTPTVAIMGPTSTWRNGSFNPADKAVQRCLPCSDCYKRTCNKFICMDIPVSEVFDAVVRRLQP